MDENSSDSDYDVEEFVRPKRVRRTVNDDSADLLGNFDDAKRKEILEGTYEEPQRNASDEESSDESMQTTDSADEVDLEAGDHTNGHVNGKDATDNAGDDHDSVDDNDDDDDDEETDNTKLSKGQLTALLRGTSKVNRHVLYVTNLNFETTREDLEAHFGSAGTVKSVRIPKKRRGGFAFVEMSDMDGYQSGFQLHNTQLKGRSIKVQFSEAGKKKSANKKNIIKQKNRKLAEMRNEQKTFTKSGKFYDKPLKKEKAKELLARKRWRKKPAARGGKS